MALRVAQVMAGAVHGGAELFFERLCAALHTAGEAVLPVIRLDPARAARLRAAGLAPVELAFGGPLDLLTTPRLARALRGFAPDVVVSWMSRATAHMPRGDWVHVGRLGGYYDLRHYRSCDHLVGNTRGIVAWLRSQGWPAARTHYLPNFADDLAGSPAAQGLPERLPGGVRLLGLGRLHRDKGFDTAIEALREIPVATLLIAGTGSERARLEADARRAQVAARVHFLGWRDDVGSLLAASDVFVCSSRVEPLGNMVIEAWSASRPVIAADAAGPAELIRGGVDGLLVARESAEELAIAVRSVLAAPDLAARLASAGRLRYQTEFAQARVTAQWRSFLASAAVRNAHNG